MDREGYKAQGVLIPFSIVLTVRDIDKEQPVYNEMSQLMVQYNWVVSKLDGIQKLLSLISIMNPRYPAI